MALTLDAPVSVPLRGELRYGFELTRLSWDPLFRRPGRRVDAPPVLLVPGFLAGDSSLITLAGWLRRRGSVTSAAGIRFNVDCAERATQRLQARLHALAERTGRRVVVIGQSRGGELARVLAMRNPEVTAGLVMLGSPVLAPLSVGPAVLGAVRSVARLGDLGLPGVFSSRCADGQCCTSYYEDLGRPMPDEVRAIAIYSRSDGIVAWQACLDPSAEHVEVRSSHTGMSVNRDVYRILDTALEEVS